MIFIEEIILGASKQGQYLDSRLLMLSSCKCDPELILIYIMRLQEILGENKCIQFAQNWKLWVSSDGYSKLRVIKLYQIA